MQVAIELILRYDAGLMVLGPDFAYPLLRFDE